VLGACNRWRYVPYNSHFVWLTCVGPWRSERKAADGYVDNANGTSGCQIGRIWEPAATATGEIPSRSNSRQDSVAEQFQVSYVIEKLRFIIDNMACAEFYLTTRITNLNQFTYELASCIRESGFNQVQSIIGGASVTRAALNFFVKRP
jgi:hypothetical protein